MLPTPGTLLRATRRMRGWVSDNEKGLDGPWIGEGDVGLVIQAWSPCGSHQVRLRLVIRDIISVFSCEAHNLAVNWLVLRTGEPSTQGP